MTIQERRWLESEIEIRKLDETDMPTIVGYALKFNRSSQNLFYFDEVLDRHCLDDTDMSNVVALINHDMNLPLARTGTNLKLEIDDIGLKFTLTPTNTTYAKDLLENMRAGIINKCSFAFTISKDKEAEKWEEKEDKYVRTIFKIDKLYDVSIVTTPAYEDTEAVLSERSQQAFEKQLDYKKEVEKIKMEVMVNG